MTDWQLAMQMYQVAPTPLTQRQPEGLLVGKMADCVRAQEIRDWQRLRLKGATIREISEFAGRDTKTIQRGLKKVLA